MLFYNLSYEYIIILLLDFLFFYSFTGFIINIL